MFKDKKTKNNVVNFVIAGTILIIVYKLINNMPDGYSILKKFMGVITPLNIGILIALFLYMPVKFFEKKFEKSKIKVLSKKANGFAITITYILALIVLVAASIFILPLLVESIKDFVLHLGLYVSKAIEFLEKYSGIVPNFEFNVSTIKTFIQNIDVSQYLSLQTLTNYTKGIASFGSGVLDVFVSIIISIYILLERKNIYSFITRLMKANLKQDVFDKAKKYSDNAFTIFLNFLNAQLIDAVIIGILETIVLLILNVKYAVFLGFLIGIANIIPYFGAIVGVGIAFLITILSGGLTQAVWMIICVTIMQQIDANIINPKIVGDQLKISPLLVIIAVVIGGAYFGIAGMFMAVPVAALLKIILIDSINYKLKLQENQKENEKINRKTNNKEEQKKEKLNKEKLNKGKSKKEKLNKEKLNKEKQIKSNIKIEKID